MIAGGEVVVGDVPDIDVPRPPRFLRIALVVLEAACWVASAVLAIMCVAAVILGFRGTVPVTARLIDGASLIENAGGVVEGGTIDVVLEDVPLSVSWPYVLVLVLGSIAWVILVLVVLRVVHGTRRGSARRRVPVGLLYCFAAAWSASSLVFPFVLGRVRPAMAEAAGVTIPGVTFNYTMTTVDLLSVLAGPLAVVVVAVMTSSRRHRSPAGSRAVPPQGR